MCIQTVKTSNVASWTVYSCSECSPSLYLYSAFNQTINDYQNVCVFDCQTADARTFPNEESNECLNLGERCSNTQLKTLNSGSLAIQCQSSKLFGLGYIMAPKGILSIFYNFNSQQYNQQLQLAQSPLENTLGQTIYTQTFGSTSEIQVLAKCTNPICKTCSQNDLNVCLTCWGRFGDNPNLCTRPVAALTSTGILDTVCFSNEVSGGGCSICNYGYALLPSKQCSDCAQKDVNCFDCSNDGLNNYQCLKCKPGYGSSAFSGKCEKCLSSNVKSCKIAANKTETITFCQEGYVLTADGQTCQRDCEQQNMYLVTETDAYGLSKLQCQTCSPSCQTCVDFGDEKCTTCSVGSFLQLNQNLNRQILGDGHGTCANLTESGLDTKKIYVLSSDGDSLLTPSATSKTQTYDGQTTNNLLDGIYQAYTLAQTWNDLSVDILLEAGTHVISRKHLQDFKNKVKQNQILNMRNTIFNFAIRPFDCEDLDNANQNPNFYRCRPSKYDQKLIQAYSTVKIINKIGSEFQIQVPQGNLQVKGVTIDSIDSILVLGTGIPLAGSGTDIQNWQKSAQNANNQSCYFVNGQVNCVGNIFPLVSDCSSLQQNNEFQGSSLHALFSFSGNQPTQTQGLALQDVIIVNTWTGVWPKAGLVRLPEKSRKFSVNFYNVTFQNTYMDQLSCSKFSDGSIGTRPMLVRNWYNDSLTILPSNNLFTKTENVLIQRRFSTQTSIMGRQIMVFTNCLFTNSNGTLDSNGNLVIGNYSGASLINMNSINLDIASVIFTGFKQISDGTGLSGDSIMIQSQQINKGASALNNVSFSQISLQTNSTTSSQYLLDYFNQNSAGINNFNNLQIQNVSIGSSSNNNRQFLQSFQVQDSTGASILFGVTNFLASNLTVYNTNQNESGYETNDYTILYIAGFDSCAISGVTMRNIQSPQKNLKLMRIDQSNNIVSLRKLNFQNITVKQGFLLTQDQVKLYDISNTTRQTIKTATLLKIAANQGINIKTINFNNITIFGHPLKVSDPNNQNSFQQIVVYNSSLIDFSLSDNTKALSQSRNITIRDTMIYNIIFNQTAFTTQNVFNEGSFFLIKTGTPESPQQLQYTQNGTVTLFSDVTSITNLTISRVTGLVNKSRDILSNNNVNQGHVIRVEGPTNLTVSNLTMNSTAIHLLHVVKGIRPEQYKAGVNLTFAHINLDFNKYRDYERQRSLPLNTKTLNILNLESRIINLGFESLQITDLQKCLMDPLSQNLNTSLFNIDTSLVASIEFLNVELSETDHYLNTLTNFPNQANNLIAQSIDKSIQTYNFISIFNIRGPSNSVPGNFAPTNYLIDNFSMVGMNFSQFQQNISIVSLNNTMNMTLSINNLNVQQIDAGTSSLSLINLNGNISDLSMEVNGLLARQTTQRSFKNALINILPLSIVQNISITFDGEDISNNIGRILQINLPLTQLKDEENVIIFQSAQIRYNQAINSLMQIGLNKQNSQVTLENVEISNNYIVGNSASVIKTLGLANSSDYNNCDSLIIKDMRFTDNLVQGIGSTNGISISQDPLTLQTGGYMSVEIQNSTFRSQLLLDQNKKLQNGSYIQIIPQKNSVINVNIDTSSFLLGSAYAGGAIYYGPNQINTSLRNATSVIQTNDSYAGYWGLYLTVKNSQFIQNQVYTSGAAIFLDFLNTYFLEFDKLNFQQNLGQLYGDNIYLRQVQPLTGSYTTNAQEGGSIYALNTIKLQVQDSNFLSQSATIRGGAIYQRTDLALSPIPNQLTLISNSTFTKCKAQQGGCLYFNNSNVEIAEATKITNSIVVLLDLQTQSFNQFIQDPVLQKSYSIADSQQILGKGPAIYFECTTAQNCQCKISSDTQFSNNQIFDFGNQKYITDNQTNGAIFYPEVPVQLEGQTPDMNNFKQLSITNGTNVVMMMTQPLSKALYTYINRIVLTGKQANNTDVFTVKTSIAITDFPVSNQTNTNSKNTIENLFGLSNFIPASNQNTSYLFGDSYLLPVVDFFQNVQVLDNQSSIQVDCTQPKSSQKNNIINIACMLDSGEQFDKKTFFAINGIIKIPAVRVLSPPNNLVQVKLNFKISSTRLGRNTAFTRTLQIQMSSCLPNEIVNLKGQCQLCKGPDFYNLNTKDLLRLQNNSSYVLQQCIKCPKNYITCNGGSNTSSNKGVRVLNNSKALFTPEYLNCTKLGGVQPCLANNQCMKGYKGILCSQCTDGYYKSGIQKGGQCLQCNASSVFSTYQLSNESQVSKLNDTLLLVEFIVIWIVPFLGIIYLVIVARKAQKIQENPQNDEIIISQQPSTTSVNEQLIRSLINYIGLIALISLIYADYWWIDEQSLFNDNLQISQLRRYTHHFLQTLIYLWGLPLNRSSELIQCSSYLKYGDSGLQTQELVNYIIGGSLIGISIIIMLINCCVKICNSRKSEQIPKNDNPEPLPEIPKDQRESKTLLYNDISIAASQNLPNLQTISQINAQYYQSKDLQEFSDLKHTQSIEMIRFDREIKNFEDFTLRTNNLQQSAYNGPNQNQRPFAMGHSFTTIIDDHHSSAKTGNQTQVKQQLIRNNIYQQNSPDEVFQAQNIDLNNVSPFVNHKKFEINQKNQYQLEGGAQEVPVLGPIQQDKEKKRSETKSKSKTKRDVSNSSEKKVKFILPTPPKNKEQLKQGEEKLKNQNVGQRKWSAKTTEPDSISQQPKPATKPNVKSLSKGRLLKLQIQNLIESSQPKKSRSQSIATSDPDTNQDENIDKKKKKGKKFSGDKKEKKSKRKQESISEKIVPIPEVNEEREIDTFRKHHDHQQFHDDIISQQNQNFFNQAPQYDDIEQRHSLRDNYGYPPILIIQNPIQGETKIVLWNVHQFNITTLIIAFVTFIITPQFLASQFMLYSCFSVQPVQPLIDAQLETLASFNIVQPNATFISSIDSSFTCPTQRNNEDILDLSGYFQPIFFAIYGVFQVILCSQFMLKKSENQQYLSMLRDTFTNSIIKGGLGAMVASKSIANSPTAEVVIAWAGFILFLFIHIYVSVKNKKKVFNLLTQDNFQISESEIANVKRIIRINSFLCIALLCANVAGIIQWYDHIYGSYITTQYVTQNRIQDSDYDIAAYIILLVGQFLFLVYWMAEFIWNLKKYIHSFSKIPEKKPAEAKQEIRKDLVLNTHSQDLNISQITKSVKLANIDRLIQHLVSQRNNISQEDGRPSITNSQCIGQSVYYQRNSQSLLDPSVQARQVNIQIQNLVSERSQIFTENSNNLKKSLNHPTMFRNASQTISPSKSKNNSFLLNNYAQQQPVNHDNLLANQKIDLKHNKSIQDLSIYNKSVNVTYRGLLDQPEYVKNNQISEPKLFAQLYENSSFEQDFDHQQIQIDDRQEIQINTLADFPEEILMTIVNENILKSEKDANMQLLQNQDEGKSSQKDQNNDSFINKFVNPISDFTDNNKLSPRRESQNGSRVQMTNGSYISSSVVISKLEDLVQDSDKQRKITQIDLDQQQQEIFSFDTSVQLVEREKGGKVMTLENNLQSNKLIDRHRLVTFGARNQFNQLLQSEEHNAIKHDNKPVPADIFPIKSTQEKVTSLDIRNPQPSENSASLVYNHLLSQSIRSKQTTPKHPIFEVSERQNNQLLLKTQGDAISVSPISNNTPRKQTPSQTSMTQQSEILNTEQQLEEQTELAKKKEQLKKKVEIIKRLKQMKNQQKDISK